MNITIRRVVTSPAVLAAFFGLPLAPGTAAGNVLGPPDFADYCNQLHNTAMVYTAAPMNPYDANSWNCTNPPGNFTDAIDVNAVCRWQFGGNSYAFTNNVGWADSWQCVNDGRGYGGPGSWTGDWDGEIKGAGFTLPAHLHLDSDDPIKGQIQVPNACNADWNETGRTSDTQRTVAATINPPTPLCVNNVWTVVLQPGEITGTDPSDATRSIDFLR